VEKIILLPEVKSILKKLKQENNVLVFTTGIFDLLHPAHKQFLKLAKAQGDFLLVGLETDKRVKRLKGQGRPIENINTRLKNVANIKAVDWVFVLPEDFEKPEVREKLIATIKPDIFAVSSHSPFQADKKALTERYNGQLIVVMDQNPNISTTKILTKLKKSS
jgi:rfaE bifunctional protein nucleotidyltransferase chain/domain